MGMRKTRERISAMLAVHAGERKLVLALLAHSVLLGTALLFTLTAANALFLSRVGPQNIPYVFLALAVVGPVSSVLQLRMARTMADRRVWQLSLLTIAVVMVGFRGLMATGLAVPVAFALLVWYRLVESFLNLEFWGVTASLLDVRQARRLYGLIGSGEIAAMAIGGFAMPGIVNRIGSENLLVVAAAAVVLCLPLLVLILKWAPHPQGVGPARINRRHVDQTPYVRLILLLVLASILLRFLVDRSFLMVVHERFPDADSAASYFGRFFAITATVTLLLRWAVTGPLLARWGPGTGLMILPASLGVSVLAGGLAAALGLPASILFASVATAKFFDRTLRHSIDHSAVQMLFQPLHRRQLHAAQTLAEGIVNPMAAGLAGLLLLGIDRLWPSSLFPMACVMGACALGWLVVALLLRGDYPRALARGLRGRVLGGEVFATQNPVALEVLHRTALGPDPVGVLHALELLALTDPGFLIVRAGDLLRHPEPQVRLAVLRGLGQAEIPQIVNQLEDIARVDADADVRAAAILLLAAQASLQRWDLIEHQLCSSQAPVRQAALSALLRFGNPDSQGRAAALLAGLAVSSQPAERVIAANVLDEAFDQGDPGLLEHLCKDPEPVVRRAAFAVAGSRPVPALLPLVVEALDDSSCRGSAVAALLRAGTAGTEALLTTLEAGGQSLEHERRLLRLLGRLPEPGAIVALLQRLGSRDPSLRLSALRALCACGFEPDEEQCAEINTVLIQEVRLGAWILRVQGERVGAMHAVLSDALATELDRCRERLLFQLELLYSREAIRPARIRYWGGSRRERALALELLDTTISSTHHDLIFPLMERLAVPLALGSLPGKHVPPLLGTTERIRQILMDSRQEFPVPQWIRCCTAYALSQRPQPARSGIRPWAQAMDGSVKMARMTLHIDTDPQDLLAELTVNSTPFTSIVTMEKVLLLKSVGIFSTTPADVLRQLTDALEEETLSTGEQLFAKGDLGTSMYVIVDGLVRVHIGDHTIVELGPREIVGELAALDPEPRSASVSALEPTRLFRIEQEVLLDLMADQPEIVQGVIRELAQRIRNTTAPYGLGS